MTAILVSRNGKGVQFNIDDVTIRQGRTAGGVRGIKLIDDDHVIAMDVATPDAQLMILSSRGYGKRTAVEKFRITGRNVQGVIAMKITDKTGPIAAAVVTGPDVEEIMVGSQKAMVFRTPIMEIRSMGRATQGVQVMTKLSEDDRVISMSAFKERTWEDFEQISTAPVKTKEITSPQVESLDEESEETDEVEVTIEDEEDAQSQLVMELPTEEESESE
jgi:DNA gyrase subunit A